MDESSAFKQLPVHPQDRRAAVVTLLEPQSGRLRYFVMMGHPFGLTSSVRNYCRRSAADAFLEDRVQAGLRELLQ